LKHYHKNPRQITKKEFADLRDSLRKFGDLSGIVHNLNTDEIISGNQRIEVFDLSKLQIDITERLPEPDEQGTVATGWVIWEGKRYTYRAVMWDEKQSEEANVRANKAGGSWNFDILANEFSVPDLLEWGFSERELQLGGFDLDQPEGDDPGAQVDKAEELREKWKVELGQLWQLGEHRLICGDCTDRAVVERVMGGEKASLFITDPPYGVSYADKNKFLNTISRANRIETPIENDHQTVPEMAELWLKSFGVMLEYSEPGCAYYIFSPQGGELMMMMMMIEKSGWLIKHSIIWVKQQFVLGRSDYHYKHEPILYGWKDGGHKFYGDPGECSVWLVDKPHISDLHPTMKPVELYDHAIKNSSKDGGIVIDPFLGSGTCVIACERLGRKCRAVEISPAYCAVSIQRWVDLCGGVPELVAQKDGD
jgi:DNA modification methylase